MANKYEIYYGQFPCHTCGEIVASMRFYKEIKLTTWMCTKRHMSEVSLQLSKKTKKDYERKNRE